MTTIFKHGIKTRKFTYGWKNKKLYRLPTDIGLRSYPLKELTLVDVGNDKGYIINNSRKSIKQLELMTTEINYKHKEIVSNDCPF